jgi:hypothetical protein
VIAVQLYSGTMEGYLRDVRAEHDANRAAQQRRDHDALTTWLYSFILANQADHGVRAVAQYAYHVTVQFSDAYVAGGLCAILRDAIDAEGSEILFDECQQLALARLCSTLPSQRVQIHGRITPDPSVPIQLDEPITIEFRIPPYMGM